MLNNILSKTIVIIFVVLVLTGCRNNDSEKMFEESRSFIETFFDLDGYDFSSCDKDTIDSKDLLKIHKRLQTYFPESVETENGFIDILTKYDDDLIEQYCLYSDTFAHIGLIDLESPMQNHIKGSKTLYAVKFTVNVGFDVTYYSNNGQRFKSIPINGYIFFNDNSRIVDVEMKPLSFYKIDEIVLIDSVHS